MQLFVLRIATLLDLRSVIPKDCVNSCPSSISRSTVIAAMGNEIVIVTIFTILSLAVGFAWVGGYLDKYQSKAQDIALDNMGENKASYGLKSTLL